MESKSSDQASLAIAGLAAILAVFLKEGEFNWMSTAVGISLALILLSYNSAAEKKLPRNMAFASVLALCALLICGVGLEKIGYLAIKLEWYEEKVATMNNPEPSQVRPFMAAIAWLCFACVFTILDKKGVLQFPRDSEDRGRT